MTTFEDFMDPVTLEKGKNFFMLVGPPGSGKSTMAKQLQDSEDANTIIVCPDDIREELSGDATDQSRNVEVFEKVYERLVMHLDSGFNVIYDATNCRSNYRFKILNTIKPHANKIVCLMSTTSIVECINRNSQRDRFVPERVIENMYFTLKKHPPTLFEGYDMIVAF